MKETGAILVVFVIIAIMHVSDEITDLAIIIQILKPIRGNNWF
jgi:hypothetical protein